MRKGLIVLITLFVGIVFTQHTYAQNKFAGRDMYGFFLRNEIYGATYGFAKINAADFQSAEFTIKYNELSSIKGDKAIFAGACVNDVYYAYEYDYTPYGPNATDFVSYNIVNNRRTPIARYELLREGVMMSIQDMTYDYKTEKMYALCFDRGLSIINEVNLKNGELTQVCELDVAGVATLAADIHGDFYTVGQDGFLYKINIADGSMQKILETGRSGMLQLQTMEFDRSNNMLYWPSCTVSHDQSEETYMLRIDVEKKTVTDLGLVGKASCLLALYIPFADGGDNAPNKPFDLKVVPAEQGVLKAELSWTNPITTFVGDELTTISSIVVERNNVEIVTYDNAKPGEAMSLTDDNITADGECKYTVYARNENGVGSKAVGYAYVGIDTPNEPKNINFTVGQYCKSAEVTWEPAVGGLHDGFVKNEEITYKVVRMPDSVVVANNMKETKFVDKEISTLQRYCYKVYACNHMGETGAYTQVACIMGDPAPLPYEETFENLENTFNTSTYVDGNSDCCTWVFGSPAGYYQFGDSYFCLEYIVNPGFEHSHEDADEWMITPPFLLDSSKSYKISFDARSIREEKLELSLGDRNVKESQTKFADLTIEGNTNANYQEFHHMEVELPAGTTGINCLGIRLITPYPENNYAHLQIRNIMVQEGTANGITAAQANIFVADNEVYTGSADAIVEAYDTTGKNVLQATGEVVSLSCLSNGIYLIKVEANQTSVVLKHIVK